MQYHVTFAILASVVAMVTCQGGKPGPQNPYGSDPGGLAPKQGQSNVQGVNMPSAYPNQATVAASGYPTQSRQGTARVGAVQYPMVPVQYPAASGGGGNLFGGGNTGSQGNMGGISPWFLLGGSDMMQDPFMCRLMGQPLSSCLMGNLIFN